MSTKVVVLMSTYNGAKYLKEQVDSIFQQTWNNIHVVIRDDGSTDDTVTIIEQYISQHPNITLIKGENIGCKRSFYELARYAFSQFSDVSFFSFSDQDDVWLPNKVKVGIESLSSVKPGQYGLYFCHTQLVDSRLNRIYQFASCRHDLSFLKLCITYVVSGCTMIFNREALELFLKGKPEEMYLHDSWLLKTVAACGGDIIEDPNAYILYRQHDRNVVGSSISVLDKWKRRLSVIKKSKRQRSNELRAIFSTYRESISIQNIEQLEMLSTYTLNFKYKMKLLLSGKISHTNGSSLFLKLSILFDLF